MSKPYARPSNVDDCAELAATLRQADLTEISLGHSPSPYDALMRGFAYSDEPISVIDCQGAVVAMMGVVSMGPGVGCPWMLASDGLERIKWPFLRECKGRLQAIHERYPFLHNQVWQGNTVHIRWLKWLGFTVSPVPIDRPLFLPFWRANNVYMGGGDGRHCHGRDSSIRVLPTGEHEISERDAAAPGGGGECLPGDDLQEPAGS